MSENLFADIINLKSVQDEGSKTLEEISMVRKQIVKSLNFLKSQNKEGQEVNE